MNSIWSLEEIGDLTLNHPFTEFKKYFILVIGEVLTLTEKELEVENVYMPRLTVPLGDISILPPMKQLEKAEMSTISLSKTSLLKVINYTLVQALNSYY